jgi:hypothetical protein
VIECQEETEQGPEERERAVKWGKVREAENPAVWADPVRQDLQATAYARSADTRNRINAEFPAWIGNVPSAGLRWAGNRGIIL